MILVARSIFHILSSRFLNHRLSIWVINLDPQQSLSLCDTQFAFRLYSSLILTSTKSRWILSISNVQVLDSWVMLLDFHIYKVSIPLILVFPLLNDSSRPFVISSTCCNTLWTAYGGFSNSLYRCSAPSLAGTWDLRLLIFCIFLGPNQTLPGNWLCPIHKPILEVISLNPLSVIV